MPSSANLQPAVTNATSATTRSPFTTPDPNQSHQPFWREYWYVTFLIVAFVVLFISYLIRAFLPTPTPPNQANTWNSITPGYSNVQQVVEKLGPPTKTSQTDRGTELNFASHDEFLPHQVVSDQGGTVRFMKEFLSADSKEKIDQYITQYGQPDLVLFDEFTGDSLAGNVFLEEGVVLFAHIEGGTIYQKWYFEPTDEATFLNTWGSTMSEFGEGPEPFEL